MPLRRCTRHDNPDRPPLGSSVRPMRPAPSRAVVRTKRAVVGGIVRAPGTPLHESIRPRWPRTSRARTAYRPRPSCSVRTRGNPGTSWPRNAHGPARDRGDTRRVLCTPRTRRSSSPSRRSKPIRDRPRAWCACRRGPARGTKARSCSASSTRTESPPCPRSSGTFGTPSRAPRARGRAGRPSSRRARDDRPRGESPRSVRSCVAEREGSRGLDMPRKARISTLAPVEPSPPRPSRHY